MAKIELSVADIHSAMHPSEAFSLILKEKEGERYVPIIIGISEARAILVELNQSPTHRPLTHELFTMLADSLSCRLVEVNIVHFENGVYYADMLMKRSDGTIFHLDSRPSDAIALALKYGTPFYMNSDIFEENCQIDVLTEDSDIEDIEKTLPATEEPQQNAFIDQKLSEMCNSELESLLEGAIESENFELAAKIQEILDNR